MTMKRQAAKPETADEKSDISFEKALERLEAIVTEMEDGKIGLEKLIERFEEGQKLIGVCNKKLNEVERRIEILVKKGEETVAEPFEPDMSGADSEPKASGKAEPDELF